LIRFSGHQTFDNNMLHKVGEEISVQRDKYLIALMDKKELFSDKEYDLILSHLSEFCDHLFKNLKNSRSFVKENDSFLDDPFSNDPWI
jgi:transcriptional regulator CtsR